MKKAVLEVNNLEFECITMVSDINQTSIGVNIKLIYKDDIRCIKLSQKEMEGFQKQISIKFAKSINENLNYVEFISFDYKSSICRVLEV